jgi:hypothetical protein
MTPRGSTRSTDWRTTVAVRVPGTDGGSQADGASRQPPRDEDVAAVGDVALQAIEPGLAATMVCVDTRLRTADRFDETTLEERLASAPGVERVEEVRSA